MAMLTPFSCSVCERIHGLNFQAQTMAENTETSEELVNSQFPQLDKKDLQKLEKFRHAAKCMYEFWPRFHSQFYQSLLSNCTINFSTYRQALWNF